ncbi:AmmeMemoRadiSam system protein B [Pseudodesulfovibrio cashew]|uniref:MEMO1 family protein GM415_16380 n=1 Tax=Pseudodesulfovibrio cashew TaxID=2678688 RepID=A0A6I6JKV7_9BACT|nr:AmmeMemoRadiSam system protein B [Pseudodesulfovibrio cashew]QGY41630.1 AmmeMemoRadiSam system protein B [Pseudodesulfovibrio cashew]
MQRQPVVAGRFYEADPERLNGMVDGFLGLAEARRDEQTLLAMVPHAGYVFSGAVCGRTLGAANLARTIVMLGPNHTGKGDRFALWPKGRWAIPGGAVSVDAALAETLLEADPMLTPDTAAHLEEHSLEVILPFLRRLDPETVVVPIAVSGYVFEDLKRVGQALGKVLAGLGRPASIVVSSDMSHYIQHDEAKARDALALEAAVALDPRGLFDVVRRNNITMCGVLPMVTGLYAALEMGATSGEVVSYATSGEIYGDYDQVVGYAGVLVS